MTIKTEKQLNLAYAQLPFKRNQDVIKIISSRGDLNYAVSVVDGWHNLDFIKGNKEGRVVAELVAENFPKEFLQSNVKNYQKRAEIVAKSMEERVLSMYSAHVSCVGAFLFSFENQDIIVALGSVVVLVRNENKWVKPKGIGNYWLDPDKYPSDVSRFIGRGELKRSDPLYSWMPEAVICPSKTSILLATDGLEKVFSVNDINSIASVQKNKTSQAIIFALLAEIRKRKIQKDDISILVRK